LVKTFEYRKMGIFCFYQRERRPVVIQENHFNSLMVPLTHLNPNHFRSISRGPFGKGAIQVGAHVPDFCALGSRGNSHILRLPKFKTFGSQNPSWESELGGALKDFIFSHTKIFYPPEPDI
jgi:hypothetical protein